MIFVHRQSTLYRLDLVRAHDAKSSEPAGYSFARLDADLLDRSPIAATRGRAAKFRERLEHGYTCVGFLDRDKIVRSYVWIAGGPGRPAEVPVWRSLKWILAGDDTYFWDCRTEASHEGRGLYRAALRLAAAQAAGTGARTAWIESEVVNAASTRGILAAGFVPSAGLDAWHIVGTTFWRAGEGWPRPVFTSVPLSAACAVQPLQE